MLRGHKGGTRLGLGVSGLGRKKGHPLESTAPSEAGQSQVPGGEGGAGQGGRGWPGEAWGPAGCQWKVSESILSGSREGAA